MQTKFYYRVLFFILILLSSCSEKEKSSDDKYIERVQTLDGTINAFYEAISSDNGKSFDWDLYKYVMYHEAKLIRWGPEKDGEYSLTYYSSNDYISRYKHYMESVNFYEKEIFREVFSYGDISHAISGYESFENGKSIIRGVNSFQLLNDGKRWWIINAYYTRETPNNPIPSRFFKKN